VRTAQLQIFEIRNVLRRRWKILLMPAIIVSTIGIIGAFQLPRKYESTTTFLVRVDKILNPVTGWEMSLALEQQMRNTNEIVYSRTFVQTLLDSLGIMRRGSEAEQNAIISAAKSSIIVNRPGSDSFVLGYSDSDPGRAQRGAEILANLFIKTKVQFENVQNEATVDYYEKKAEEYREIFESSARNLVISIKKDATDAPESRAIYNQIDNLEKQITALTAKIREYQEVLGNLRSLPDIVRQNSRFLRSESGKQMLLSLLIEDLPLVDDLRTLVNDHDDLVRRYTENYPEVQRIEDQMLVHLSRIEKGVEVEMRKAQNQQWEVERKRTKTIGQLQESSTADRQNQEKQSNFETNRKQYEEMRAKLEQAKINEEVGKRGANQFIILDPAPFPTAPTKPNRPLIILGSIALGILLGAITTVVTEFLDTTIRSPKDIAVYQKPVIAMLPEATRH